MEVHRDTLPICQRGTFPQKHDSSVLIFHIVAVEPKIADHLLHILLRNERAAVPGVGKLIEARSMAGLSVELEKNVRKCSVTLCQSETAPLLSPTLRKLWKDQARRAAARASQIFAVSHLWASGDASTSSHRKGEKPRTAHQGEEPIGVQKSSAAAIGFLSDGAGRATCPNECYGIALLSRYHGNASKKKNRAPDPLEPPSAPMHGKQEQCWYHLT